MRMFEIVLKTPLGPRTGTLTFEQNGQVISGHLNLLHQENEVRGFLDQEGRISLSGGITTLIRTIPFHAQGKIENGRIDVMCQTKNNKLALYGTEAI